MKKAILSLTGVLLLLACEQQNKAGEKVSGLGKPTGEEIHFTVNELSEEDFDVVERNDTTYYLKQLHEGLEGKDIQFDRSLVSDLSAKVRFGFGFLQYTTDDNSAIPLEFTKQSKWSDLQIKDGVIEIPDLNGNSNNRKVYETLGFQDRKELLEWIAGDELEEIKNESIQAQINFYQSLLKKKNNTKAVALSIFGRQMLS
ncbi:hypothetical protein [Pontibacter virosus]|uniref:Uncharacterized protein n=1 Tax=Pontibacter virosus TaxID=1765052 RepID=A0A2U1ATC3_9BACT|nr:hypothetical protein [Pontibacter virosus]PVY39658.1 hypothetical protein C8E01_11047 [Pontibacter virosus]